MTEGEGGGPGDGGRSDHDPGIGVETGADRLATSIVPRPGGSGLLVVVFSQVRVPAGKFGLSRLFARTAHHALFVNDRAGGWYRGCEAAIDAAVDAAVAETRPARIVYYGSSMGGFGALAAATRRDDGPAVAFVPDLAIGEPGSRSAEAGLVPQQGEVGLADLLARPARRRHTVVFGLYDPYDAGTAAAVHGLGAASSADLVAVASGHEVHDHLYSVNVVRRVIATFARPLAAELRQKGLLVEAPDWPALGELGRLARAFASGEAVDPRAVDRLGLSGNPGAARLAAEAALRAGEQDDALARLAALDARLHADTVFATLPKRAKKAPALRLLALLRQAGRSTEAAALAARLTAIYGADERFHEGDARAARGTPAGEVPEEP